MPTRSLVNKARASSRRARSCMMSGGAQNAQLKQQVEEAIARARQAAQRSQFIEEDEIGQEGGDKNLEYPSAKAQVLYDNLPAPKPKIETFMNSLRSYHAVVNGKPLVGKSSRLFHGTPEAAARKVVSMITKSINGEKVVKPVEATATIDTPAQITLIEATKGVHKTPRKGAKSMSYVYNYYGWKEKIIPHEIIRNGEKVMIPEPYTRGGKNFIPTLRNVVIPARGMNFADAMKYHEVASARSKSKFRGIPKESILRPAAAMRKDLSVRSLKSELKTASEQAKIAIKTKRVSKASIAHARFAGKRRTRKTQA
jgi:hypothetical protein